MGWSPKHLSSGIEAPADDEIQKGKVLRMSTLLKGVEDALMIKAVLQGNHRTFPDQRSWRDCITEHWECGIEELIRLAAGEDDWITIISNVIDSSMVFANSKAD